MDEYDAPAHEAPVDDASAAYDAPAPPLLPPPPPTEHEGAHAGRRRPRLLAAGAALALLVAAAGAGAGFALGRSHHDAGSAGRAPSQGYGSGGQSPRSGQGGTYPFGGTPFAGPGAPGGAPFDSSTATGTKASAGQLTGLVRITTTLKYAGGRAAGTGMILTSDGEVITNHHVVAGATSIQVTVMSTGQHYSAAVIGTDATDDVAVIQLTNASGLATVTTDTAAASLGDDVTAVGDAGGSSTRFTAASGKVIGIGRQITTESEGGSAGEKLAGLIEISSDVISGDSGGATYDDQGQVLGMTTAASTGGSDVVGYAIPIAKVLRIADDLENGTQNTRYVYGTPAFVGLGLQRSSTTVSAVFPGTPAAKAGLAPGDTVTRVGGTRVRTSDALRRAITSHSPGDRVSLTWTDTQGTTHIATVTLIPGPVA